MAEEQTRTDLRTELERPNFFPIFFGGCLPERKIDPCREDARRYLRIRPGSLVPTGGSRGRASGHRISPIEDQGAASAGSASRGGGLAGWALDSDRWQKLGRRIVKDCHKQDVAGSVRLRAGRRGMASCGRMAAAVAVALIARVGTGAIAADAPAGWLCVAEKATGFHYDKTTKAWNVATFNSDEKFLFRKPNDDEIRRYRSTLGGSWKPAAYIVIRLGKVTPPDVLPKTCGDLIPAFGTIKCQSTFEEFVINTKLSRFQMTSEEGYITQSDDKESDAATPFIEIGRCAPL
jgi:hypothetical protein